MAACMAACRRTRRKHPPPLDCGDCRHAPVGGGLKARFLSQGICRGLLCVRGCPPWVLVDFKQRLLLGYQPHHLNTKRLPTHPFNIQMPAETAAAAAPPPPPGSSVVAAVDPGRPSAAAAMEETPYTALAALAAAPGGGDGDRDGRPVSAAAADADAAGLKDVDPKKDLPTPWQLWRFIFRDLLFGNPNWCVLFASLRFKGHGMPLASIGLLDWNDHHRSRAAASAPRPLITSVLHPTPQQTTAATWCG